MEEFLNSYGIIPNSLKLFEIAMSHSSYANEHKDKKNYERLEFLGDAIIKPIISIYLVERYPYENEGFLSTLRTKIESTNTLSHFFKCLGLHDYILLSQSVEQENGRNNIHILEDCFEAFIGALFKYSQLNGISYGDIMNIIQKLMNILIEKFYGYTYYAILGFIIGSIIFIFPGFTCNLVGLASIITFAIGFTASYFVSKINK